MYDRNGNISNESENHIIIEGKLNDLNKQYVYDPVGYRLQRIEKTYKEIATLSAPIVSNEYFSYDNNGSMLQQKITKSTGDEITNYGYNEYNQLTTITNSQGTTSYTYNPEGLRNSKTQGTNKTGYYYDGDNVIIETINNNLAARNIMGINPIARETGTLKLYYLYNGHADVVAMVDASGDVVNSYSYNIYGNILSANETGGANPIRYAGQYYDNESDMYYLRARYYDPELMRFIVKILIREM